MFSMNLNEKKIDIMKMKIIFVLKVFIFKNNICEWDINFFFCDNLVWRIWFINVYLY